MKKILLMVIMVLISSVCAIAQVPQEMMYQVMAIDQQTGNIKRNTDVNVKISLRQGAVDGKEVWSQEFNTTTNKSGICNLKLSLSEKIDWDNGPYYFSVKIDDEECGAPQITSVPYALRAKYVEGVPTREELVGVWKATGKYSTYTYTFRNDGTCKIIEEYYNNGEPYQRTYEGKYYYNGAGSLVYNTKGEFEYAGDASLIKISESEIVVSCRPSYIFKKQ